MGANMNSSTRIRSFCVGRLSRFRLVVITILAFLFIYYVSSPYDSITRSAIRWQSTVAADYIQHTLPSDKWVLKQQQYPIDPVQDVGIIVKTGYGTRERIPKFLAAFSNQTFDSDMLIVQDYPLLPKEEYAMPNGKKVPVVDIIGWMFDEGKILKKDKNERITKYESMADAIDAEDWFMSDTLSKGNGWELDAMKFISGLEYAWKLMPGKKWYIMADDDTYVIKESLSLVLGHLNPSQLHYLGNPVGDFKGRFAHGGSSAIVSGAAVEKLFQHPKIVADAHKQSLTETWGDKLLATTLMAIGVYLDEGYSRVFNGEPPLATRMWMDRFCLPLLSFHGLGRGNLMEEVSGNFTGLKEPVFWRQLAKIYGGPDFDSFVAEPIRVNEDFVGRLDEHSVTVDKIENVEECVKLCSQNANNCLAWTWDQARKQCHYAPWTIVGAYKENALSGVNYPLAKQRAEACHTPPAPLMATE